MIKKVLIILVVISVVFIAVDIIESIVNWESYRFKELLPLLPVAKEQIIAEDYDWYVAYKITDEQMAEILNTDFSVVDFTDWQLYEGNFSIGTGDNTFSIYGGDGQKDIKCSCKIGSRGDNEIAMYLFLNDNKLVLHWGIIDGR